MEDRLGALRAACGPVLADLDRTRPGCARLQAGPGYPDGPDAWLWDTETGAGTGLWWVGAGTHAEQVEQVTGQVQDVAFEILWRPWPECPDHPNGHPLVAASRDGEAVWTCDRSGHVVARVGELPVSGQPRAAS